MRTPIVTDGEREARCAPLTSVEVRETDDGITVSGYAAVFDSLSEDLGGFVEEIKRGAFRKVLRSGPDVRFLINHDGVPLARTTNDTLRLSEDSKGLRIEADLPDTTQARDLATSINRGDLDQMSFMFTVGADGREWDFDAEPAVRTIHEMSGLFDVSAVTFPAYPATQIGVRGVIAGESIADESGELSPDLLEQVCERVHGGDLAVTVAERRELDRAADKLSIVTPWRRSAPLGSDEEQPAEETPDAEAEGGAYGLAARSRRLKRLEVEAPESCRS